MEEEYTLAVRVHPGASKNEITGYSDNVLEVRITARPDKGKANEALIKYIGGILGIPKSRVEIRKGLTSRNKLLRILGMNSKSVETAVNDIISHSGRNDTV